MEVLPNACPNIEIKILMYKADKSQTGRPLFNNSVFITFFCRRKNEIVFS